MRFVRHSLWLGVLLAVAACKGEKKSNDVLAQDSTLNRDLALANQDTTVRPQLKDVPDTAPKVVPVAPPTPHAAKPKHVPPPLPPRKQVASVTPPPSPPPPPIPPVPATTPSGNRVSPSSSSANSEGAVGTISAGTTLTLAAGQQVCTNTNSVGDRFTASLAQAVTGSNGVVLPAGSTVVLEVSSLKQSQNVKDNLVIGLIPRSISYGGKSYPLNAEITSAQTQQVKSANNNDAKKVGAGAAIGAVLGNIFGGGSRVTRTIIGAAGGAAAGAVVAHETAKYDACIPSGGQITVRLDQSMQVQSVASAGNI